MQYVEIYKLKHDGSQEIVAICKLVRKEVACSGDKILAENLKNEGIKDYSDQAKHKKLFFGDGLKFLKNLKFNFKSGYLNASDIINK